MIALKINLYNKELFEKLKKESLHLCILFAALIVIFKIIYYNESLLSILRVVFTIFYMFILPGFLIMYHWDFDFLKRLFLGIALSAASVGILSYYIGIIGFRHHWIVPLLIILFSVIFNYSTKQQQPENN